MRGMARRGGWQPRVFALPLELGELFAEPWERCEWLQANDLEWFVQGGMKRYPKIVVAIPRE